MRFWPPDTIFVSVVDPGVGTARRACVALTEAGYLVVTPDNGTLTHVADEIGIREVRQIDESVNRLRGKDTDNVSVFNGRDVFAYCAARLAAGQITFEQVGPAYPVGEIVRLPITQAVFSPGRAQGIAEIGDPNFGNLWTNVPTEDFQRAGFHYGDRVHILITCQGEERFSAPVLFAPTFGAVLPGQPVLYNNELMHLALALREANLSQRYGLAYGPDWEIVVEAIDGKETTHV